MGKIIIGIIGTIIGVIVDRLVNWLLNKVKEKKPLEIKINSQYLSALSHSGVISRERPLNLWIPVNFNNRTSYGFDLSFSNFKFYPKERIQQLNLDIQNRIHTIKQIGYPSTNFVIEPNSSKTAYLYVWIKPKKEYTWDEFRKLLREIKNKSVAIQFNYVISTDGKERKYYTEIKNFFKDLEKAIEKF